MVVGGGGVPVEGIIDEVLGKQGGKFQGKGVLVKASRVGKDHLVDGLRAHREGDQKQCYGEDNLFHHVAFRRQRYSIFMEGVSSSAESLLSNAKEFISRLLPIEEDILDLPQQIATKKKKKIIVCIDEFQQIGEFADTLKFQKILRNHWQQHKDVAYILYGSKKHMMLNIFGKNSSPFYRVGDMMFLDKIANEEWKKFIVGRFKDTGKSITAETAGYLAEQVENHPYYVQQLAQYSWLRTEKACA